MGQLTHCVCFLMLFIFPTISQRGLKGGFVSLSWTLCCVGEDLKMRGEKGEARYSVQKELLGAA
eukprot:716818-Amphidinium_carterae.1